MSADRWSDMVGAYVLDALDAEDREAFEAQLVDDAALRRLVDEARASTLLLAEALPETAPPAHVRERVLQHARSSRRVGRHDDPVRDLRDTRGGRRTAAVVTPWILLAASIAGLFWLARLNTELTESSARLAAQLDSARASLGQAEVALARFDSLALAISGPDVQFATLAGDTDPRLRLVWNQERELLLVTAQNLPPAPAGRTFQLWGIRGDEPPVSLGTFDTNPGGSALVTLTAGDLGDFDVSAITEEPVGGSPQPTTQPFLVGPWTAA